MIRVPPWPSDIGTVLMVIGAPLGTTVSSIVAVGNGDVCGGRSTPKPVGLIVTGWLPIVKTSIVEDGSVRVLVLIIRVPENPSNTGIPLIVIADAPGRTISDCVDNAERPKDVTIVEDFVIPVEVKVMLAVVKGVLGVFKGVLETAKDVLGVFKGVSEIFKDVLEVA